MRNYLLNNGLVLVDLDDTLYREIDYIGSVVKQFCKVNLIDLDIADKALHEFERERHQDTLDFFLKKFEIMDKFHKNQIFDIYCNSEIKIKLYNGVFDFLKNQIPPNIHLAILTNGVVQVQKNKVRLLGLDEVVEKIFYARDAGSKFEKPHPVSYQTVLNYFNISAKNSVMVGDNLKNDFLGAKNLGIEAILVKKQKRNTWLQSSLKAKSALMESIELCQNLINR